MAAPETTADGNRFAVQEIRGVSPTGFSDATDHALALAAAACGGQQESFDWYEVAALAGTFQDGCILQWEVTLRVGRGDGGA